VRKVDSNHFDIVYNKIFISQNIAIEPEYVSELYEALTKKVELGGNEPMQVEPSE
jgi:hypothetical protein